MWQSSLILQGGSCLYLPIPPAYEAGSSWSARTRSTSTTSCQSSQQCTRNLLPRKLFSASLRSDSTNIFHLCEAGSDRACGPKDGPMHWGGNLMICEGKVRSHLAQAFKLQTFANIYRKIPMPDVATVDISHLYLPICVVVYFPVRLFFGSDFWDASFEHLTVATVSFKLKSTVHAFGKIAVTKGLGMPGMPPVWQGAGGFVGVFFWIEKKGSRILDWRRVKGSWELQLHMNLDISGYIWFNWLRPSKPRGKVNQPFVTLCTAPWPQSPLSTRVACTRQGWGLAMTCITIPHHGNDSTKNMTVTLASHNHEAFQQD